MDKKAESFFKVIGYKDNSEVLHKEAKTPRGISNVFVGEDLDEVFVQLRGTITTKAEAQELVNMFKSGEVLRIKGREDRACSISMIAYKDGDSEVIENTLDASFGYDSMDKFMISVSGVIHEEIFKGLAATLRKVVKAL